MDKGRNLKRTRNRTCGSRGQRGADEDILRCHRPNSPLCIIAIHGGRMEPGTTEIASGIAGNEFSLYSFVSRKKSDVHIRSDDFSEPMVQQHRGVVSIHGLKDKRHAFDVYVGGLDEKLKSRVISALLAAEFRAVEDTTRKHPGREARNICNGGTCGQGLQLEITNRLRKRMFEDLNRRKGREKTTPRFADFVNTVRTVLLKSTRPRSK
jgi:phage replication-related protein YjqB (UPF0714/DUF867 family)